MQDLDYRVKNSVEPNDQSIIVMGLETTATESGLPTREPLSIIGYALESVVAGIVAHTMGSSLFIKYLWVDTAFRSQSVGRRLMEMAEAEAQGRGCKTSFVDTMSYQAPDFYQKVGYAETARVTGYQDAHDRIFLKKNL